MDGDPETYLYDYVGTIDNLPAEIQYHFTELSVKDKELAEAYGRIQRRQARLFASSASEDSSPLYGKLIEKIRSDFKLIEKLQDEKENITDKASQLLSRHVNRLDNDLKKHWPGHGWDIPNPQTPPLGPMPLTSLSSLPSLSRTGSMARRESQSSVDRVLSADMKIADLPVLPSPHAPPVKRRKSGGAAAPPRLHLRLTPGSTGSMSPPPPLTSSRVRSRKSRAEEDNDDNDNNVEGAGREKEIEEDDTTTSSRRNRGPSRQQQQQQQQASNQVRNQETAENTDEEIYCFCRAVSFGEMIGCDNDNCPIEWFHLSCVKLDKPPEGKWYCSSACRAEAIKR